MSTQEQGQNTESHDSADALYFSNKINPMLDASLEYLRTHPFDASVAEELIQRLDWLWQIPNKTLEVSLLVSDVCGNLQQIAQELLQKNPTWANALLQHKSATIDRSMLDASWADRPQGYPFSQTPSVDLHAASGEER